MQSAHCRSSERNCLIRDRVELAVSIRIEGNLLVVEEQDIVNDVGNKWVEVWCGFLQCGVRSSIGVNVILEGTHLHPPRLHIDLEGTIMIRMRIKKSFDVQRDCGAIAL